MKTFLNLFLLSAAIMVGQIPIFGQNFVINDNFNGTAINTNTWTVIIPYCDSQMNETNHNAVFVNGGQLLSKTALPTQISVSGSFALTGSQYDQFSVWLRTDGTKLNGPNQTFYTGIQIDFSYSDDPASGNSPGVKNINIADNTSGNFVTTNFPLAMNTFYQFTILDDGANVTLYLGNMNTPLISLATTNRAGNLLGLQNRMGACAGSGISAGSVSQLHYITVSNSTFTAGIISFPAITIVGNTNQMYSIQYVNNLLSTNWITLVSNIVLQSPTNTYYYPDTNVLGQPTRFYRVFAQ